MSKDKEYVDYVDWRKPDDSGWRKVREFESGATRDTEEGKLDYEGFLSPEVLQEFAEYMHEHRKQKDGSLRSSDNWQKGIPKDAYMKSMWRHFMDLWLMHRLNVDQLTRPGPEGEGVTKTEALAGLMFNVQGYWFETIKETKS